MSLVCPVQKQLRGSIPDDQLWECSAYVVGEVFRALRQSFANARGIQVTNTSVLFTYCTYMYIIHVHCC